MQRSWTCVPDYTPTAMAEQAERLKGFQQRLAAIDDSHWPVSERVDYMLVLAEMRGLEQARSNPRLQRDAVRARNATDKFLAWLEEIEAKLPAHGGIGREEYDWYLKHVLLFPYTWEEMRVIAQREYERSLTFLKIEEHRHHGAPMIETMR